MFRLFSTQQQQVVTFFLRDRPALELMRRLADTKAEGSTLRVAMLGCSAGAEVYSILWTIRRAWPDLKVLVHAVDISSDILKFAETGVYAPNTSGLVGCSIFRAGDLWQCGDHHVFCGDATNEASFAALMKEKPAVLVLTDPPHNPRIDGPVSGKGKTKHREFAQGLAKCRTKRSGSFWSPPAAVVKF